MSKGLGACSQAIDEVESPLLDQKMDMSSELAKIPALSNILNSKNERKNAPNSKKAGAD